MTPGRDPIAVIVALLAGLLLAAPFAAAIIWLAVRLITIPG